ncbi:MAG: GNAT family N-acetyltransferase [Thermoplasmata archaeon]|nr:GNAT family N-acetyltransferase [Thermoplasmata archaeon]
MRRTWNLRTYEAGDEKGIARLSSLIFPDPGGELTLEKWRWKYCNTPRNLIVVAEHESRIIGHMGLMLVRMKVGKKIVTGCHGVDLLVHPDFRRRGIFRDLVQVLLRNSKGEGIQLWCGIPTPPAYYGHLKYGHFDVGDIRVQIRLLNTEHVVLGFLPKLHKLSRAARVLTKVVDTSLSALSNITEMEQGGIEVVRLHTFDSSINRLWHEVSNRYEIMAVREEEYLNWRYCMRSDKPYETFAAMSGGTIMGYVVCAEEETGQGKCGYIVDILVSSDEILRVLTQFCLGRFATRNVDIVKFWAPPAFAGLGMFRRQGFFPSPNALKLIALVNSSDLSREFLSQPRNWYYTMGDTDTI